jgi:hypothetical protein
VLIGTLGRVDPDGFGSFINAWKDSDERAR